MRDSTPSSAAFHAIALVAAARTALHTARSVADRRAGRDPSAQEPEAEARADLDALIDRLSGYVARLRLRLVAGVPEGEAAALAQAFEDQLLMDDLTAAVRLVHQKLLSLYPAVPEEIVEDTRRLAMEVSDGTDAEGLALLVRQTADWVDRLREALA